MLFCLWVWGPQETRELAVRMGVSRPTVSGVTDTLERRGLVERRCARRGRAACARVALTAAGERTFEELFPRFNAEESLACGGLGSRGARATRGAPAHARDNDSEGGREMAVDVTAAPTGARTGAQYLAGLRDDGREVWMDGERIDDVVGHPLLGGARARPGGLVRLVPRARRDVPVRVADDRASPSTSPSCSRARARTSCAAASACARWRSTTAA